MAQERSISSCCAMLTHASLSDSQTLILEHAEIKTMGYAFCASTRRTNQADHAEADMEGGAWFYHCSRLSHLPRRNKSDSTHQPF